MVRQWHAYAFWKAIYFGYHRDVVAIKSCNMNTKHEQLRILKKKVPYFTDYKLHLFSGVRLVLRSDS